MDRHPNNKAEVVEVIFDEAQIAFYAELENLGKSTNSCASMPIDVNEQGKAINPNITLLKRSIENRYSNEAGANEADREVIEDCAISLYLQNSGQAEELRSDNPMHVSHVLAMHKNYPLPNLKDLKFLVELNNLESAIVAPALTADSRKTIEYFISGLALPKIQKGSLYSPYFLNGVQITVNNYYLALATYIQENMDDLVLDNPFPIIFDETEFNKAHLLPSYLPANLTPNDFDSGQCDAFNNTTFLKGDIAWVVAAYGDWAFVRGKNAAGWVNLSDDTTTSNIRLPITSTEPKETSPDDLINDIWKKSTFYIHGANDCSAFIKRTFLKLGYRVSSYSGDMCNDLESAGLPAQLLTAENQLTTFSEKGLYVIQLLRQIDDQRISQHVYLGMIDRKGNFIAVSQVFNTFSETNVPIYPIGTHLSTKLELANHIKKGRHLKFIKIAG